MAKIKKLGVQLYTIRDFMTNAQDIRESFKKLKAIGYDQAQTAGCRIPYEEFGQIAKEEGIEIVGTHDNFLMMCNDFDTALKNHLALGTKIMGCGGFVKDNMDEYINFVKDANMVGEKLKAVGGKFTYHHHHQEFVKLPGNDFTTIDYLVDNLNAETTSFVLDTHWVQRGGGDVCAWIKKLKNRIDIIHLKDFKVNFEENNLGMALPDYAEIGSGNLNWDGIFEAAEQSNVKYYVVEQDDCSGSPFDSLKMSSDFIHKNFM